MPWKWKSDNILTKGLAEIAQQDMNSSWAVWCQLCLKIASCDHFYESWPLFRCKQKIEEKSMIIDWSCICICILPLKDRRQEQSRRPKCDHYLVETWKWFSVRIKRSPRSSWTFLEPGFRSLKMNINAEHDHKGGHIGDDYNDYNQGCIVTIVYSKQWLHV